jgi:hypothetical protein
VPRSLLPDPCCACVRGFAQTYALAGRTAATGSPLGPIARHSMPSNAARSNSRFALECQQEPTQRARALPSSRTSLRSERANVPSEHHPFAFGIPRDRRNANVSAFGLVTSRADSSDRVAHERPRVHTSVGMPRNSATDRERILKKR